MKYKILFVATIASIFTACSSDQKKIVVAYKGKTTIDEKDRTITYKDGAAGGDKEIIVSGTEKVTYNFTNEGDKKAFDFVDNGSYFVNVRPDTLIGTFQNFGSLQKESKIITQDIMMRSIDSLKNLVANKNISNANKNFFVLPFSMVKVTPNSKAVIIAPFHQISTLEKVDGKAPEVYQFWTINEIREKIRKQTDLVDGKPTKK